MFQDYGVLALGGEKDKEIAIWDTEKFEEIRSITCDNYHHLGLNQL